MKRLIAIIATVLASLTLVAADKADKEPTAFALIKEGNRYVGEQAKDRVVQLRSERSIGSLNPRVWYVVYHDPTASMKAVEVKFAAGKMIDVKRPFRLVERIADKTSPMDKEKLKIDSNKAIEIALKEPILEDIKVKSVEATLQNDGTIGPVWKLKLWAERLSGAQETAGIGHVMITADEGKVIENEINLKRLD